MVDRDTAGRLVWAFVAAGLFVVGAPAVVRAQPGAESASERGTLPAPPAGYHEEQRRDVLWVYPGPARSEVADLQGTYDTAWPRITADLGGGIDDSLVIRIGRNPTEMRALAPRGYPPPAYATGVAYPAAGIVLLTLTAPETWERPPLDQVLTHELSHIALGRAIGQRPVPRWFAEGLAIGHADEFSISRTRVLWQAVVTHELLPLRELDSRFPQHPRQVGVAYAEAESLVAYLLRGKGNAKRFSHLIEGLRRGKPFEAALVGAYGLSTEALEQQWRAWLHERFQVWPLVLGGGTLWVLVSILLLFAWARYKRRSRAKLARWQEEEDAVDHAEEAADRRIAELEEAERVVVYVSGEPAQGREPGVPTVHHEGRNHTLH